MSLSEQLNRAINLTKLEKKLFSKYMNFIQSQLSVSEWQDGGEKPKTPVFDTSEDWMIDVGSGPSLTDF